MTNSLDKIFSPDRLRLHWQNREDVAARRDDTQVPPAGSQGPMAVFARLQRRIHQRFPGEEGDVLHVMLDELQELLVRRFPETDDAETSEDDKAALNLAIEEALNKVEDLVEALEL